MRLLLLPFSWLYGLVVRLRNLCYDKGWLRSVEFEFPIILMGNLSTGGTGKTPHVEMVLRMLRSKYTTAILSRGYKRQFKGFGIATPLSLVEDIGDEPKLFKYHFPDVEVAVCADRVEGVAQLLTDEPATRVIIMDDGFQHRRLKASMNILLTTWQKPWFRDHLLPAGSLREPVSGMRRAHIVIVTGCPSATTEAEMQNMRRKINPGAGQMVFFSGIRYGSLYPLFTDIETRSLDAHDAPVLLTGIAGVSALQNYLQDKYTRLVKCAFPDHHYFTEADIKRVRDMSGAHRTVITTEKDAMRLMESRALIVAAGLHIWVQPIEVVLLKDAELFEHIILSHVAEQASEMPGDRSED